MAVILGILAVAKPFLPYILAALAAGAAFLGYGAKKKAQGRQEATDAITKANDAAGAAIAADKAKITTLSDQELDNDLLRKDP